MLPASEAAFFDLAPPAREEALCRAASAVAAFASARVAWAHGSFLGTGPFRDLDVAVWFDPSPRWCEPGDLGYAVWQALGGPVWSVDVQVLNDASPTFRDRVARGGRLLFERRPGDALELTVVARSLLIDQEEWLRTHGEGR